VEALQSKLTAELETTRHRLSAYDEDKKRLLEVHATKDGIAYKQLGDLQKEVRLLSAVCCLLSAVCCLLSAVCCLLSAVCCLLSAVCCLLPAPKDGIAYEQLGDLQKEGA
jgi:hypothetical protein